MVVVEVSLNGSTQEGGEYEGKGEGRETMVLYLYTILFSYTNILSESHQFKYLCFI